MYCAFVFITNIIQFIESCFYVWVCSLYMRYAIIGLLRNVSAMIILDQILILNLDIKIITCCRAQKVMSTQNLLVVC